LSGCEVEIFGVGQGVIYLAYRSKDLEMHNENFRRGEDVAHAIFCTVGFALGAVYASHGLAK
jgi:hypothetical protein